MVSHLATNQILDDCYDQAGHQLRVAASVTVTPSGPVDCIISQVDDSIKIGDGTDIMAVDADGSANVRVTNSTPIDVSVSGAVAGSFTPQGLTVAGRITQMTIDDTTWYLAPAVPLSNRNNIEIQNQSTNGGIVLWNYSAGATATVGVQMPQGASRSVAVKPSIPVYVRMLSGTGIVCIEEIS